jgi:hypothetical protein
MVMHAGTSNTAAASTGDNSSVQLSIPCLSVFVYNSPEYEITSGGLLQPCGIITVNETTGRDISWPFGTFHIPDARGVRDWCQGVDDTFAHFTLYFLFLFFVCDLIWYGLFYFFPSLQPDYFDDVKDLWAGRLSPPDSFLTPEEVEDWKNARAEYDSEDFIAKGNIYRALALFEPRDPNVGWYRWSQYVLRAVICAWMQLYIPYTIISQTLDTWTFRGPKSIFWLGTNFGSFVAMFVALAELAIVFSARTSSHLIKGAKANNFILSHYNPTRGNMSSVPTPQKPATSTSTPMADREPLVGEQQTPVLLGNVIGGLEVTLQPDWALDDRLFRYQQFFWCSVSMTCTFLVCIMLPTAFLLKAATYTGNVESIAVELTALYFIYDLDSRVMESDPQTDLRFRYVIKRQRRQGMRPEEQHPKKMRRCVGIAKLFLDFSLKYIILVALSTSWESGGRIIGGHTF